MRVRGWGAFGTLLLASIAAFHQAVTSNFGMWLAYLLAIFAVLFAVGPASQPLARWAHRDKWGGRKMMLAVGIAGLVGAGVVGALVKFAIDSYRAEQTAIDDRAREEKNRRAEEQRLVEALVESNKELVAQRIRSDAAETKRQRQLAKYQIASVRIAAALDVGGGLRYRVEDAINAASRAGTVPTFEAEFDHVHTPDIEKWRTTTATMLDKELPGARLGKGFSEVLGEYGVGRSGFRLTQIKECLNYLRKTQQELRSHIELLIP